MAIDPVCGMEVDPAQAAATFEYKGETYYFCAPGCKAAFEKEQELSKQRGQEVKALVPLNVDGSTVTGSGSVRSGGITTRTGGRTSTSPTIISAPTACTRTTAMAASPMRSRRRCRTRRGFRWVRRRRMSTTTDGST